MKDYDETALEELMLALLSLFKKTFNVKKIPTTIPTTFLKDLEVKGYGKLSKSGEHFEFTDFGEEVAEEFFDQYLDSESVEIQNQIASELYGSLNDLLLDMPEIIIEENTKKVFTMKIVLNHIKPPVWRRVKIPGYLSLEDLKQIIFLLFNWSGSHLYAFSINNYELPDTSMDFMPGPDDLFEPDDSLEAYQLSGIIGDTKKFGFTYDFGDEWEHEIIIEKVEEIENFVTPEVLKVVRESPMEDIGGSFMFTEIKSILSDKKHPEYKETLEMYGDEISNSLPDINYLNKILRGMYPSGNLRIIK